MLSEHNIWSLAGTQEIFVIKLTKYIILLVLLVVLTT